ncbi:MAG: class I adenylate-forming enzyme family protein [Candidatus Omnitrophica bacterium]|nr:class I adenylate-forming enzyme family protein [Candidatus Omnitrophota bacterium]
MNITVLLEKQAKERPDKPALIFRDSSVSFKDLRDNSFKLANFLIEQGIQKGDKVAVFLPNIPQYIYSYFAVFSAGAVCVPLDFMLTQEEIVNFINHSDAKLLIAQPKKDIDAQSIQTRCLRLKQVVILNDNIGASSARPDIEINEQDISSIFYTSGSTGHPKGVVLTHKHFDSPVKTIEHFLGASCDDIYLCGGVPFSHLGGFDYALFMLYFGSTLVLMERFHPLEFLRNTEKHKVTIFCIVPAMYVAILSLKEYDKFDFSHLKYAVVFGAPSSPELLNRFHKAYPNACLLNGWGLTETAAPNAYSPKDINKLSSIGKLDFEIEAKIVDGELWIRGDAVMKEYYKEPQLTREVLSEDGWFKTGDIVRQDEEGLYYIIGRKKEMIKVSGEIVYSPEVEAALMRHPLVKEAAVIGVADELRGEAVAAFIVAKDGAELKEADIRQFSRQHLAHFKIPHHINFVDSLPKNRTGKVDKEALRK